MTVFHTPEVQGNDPFAPFYPHAFISLTTFRKSGEAVPTTVWFAPGEDGRIYVTTQKQTGKLKRIHHTPRVQMTPSDRMGKLLDEQTVLVGHAREVTPDEYKKAEAALLKKYGDEYTTLMARMGDGQAITRTYIEIVAKQASL